MTDPRPNIGDSNDSSPPSTEHIGTTPDTADAAPASDSIVGAAPIPTGYTVITDANPGVGHVQWPHDEPRRSGNGWIVLAVIGAVALVLAYFLFR